ncbi:MAG: hypothetical protein KKH02_04875 [Proteobacteria bacterium]|nr:hypothetical protein [Pseudomonadota bacterium]MBU4581736.1 hypothetical protein [Pseudomonadota bacterium]MCG2739489.1 hypothetical protein [Syntrophaceae bacterium]
MTGEINDQGFNLKMVDQNGAGPGFYGLSMGYIPFQKYNSQERISQNQQFRDPLVIEIEEFNEQLRGNRGVMFFNDIHENLGNSDILNNSRFLIRVREIQEVEFRYDFQIVRLGWEQDLFYLQPFLRSQFFMKGFPFLIEPPLEGTAVVVTRPP